MFTRFPASTITEASQAQAQQALTQPSRGCLLLGFQT